MLFLLFLIRGILRTVRWHLTVILVCIYLIVKSVEHLFKCLLTICMSSLDKLFQRHIHIFCQFLICIYIHILDVELYICLMFCILTFYQFSSIQSLSCVWLFATPWTAAHQASLPITNSWSLFKSISIELVMPCSHLILCCPLYVLPSIFPNIRVFSNESVLHIRW